MGVQTRLPKVHSSPLPPPHIYTMNSCIGIQRCTLDFRPYCRWCSWGDGIYTCPKEWCIYVDFKHTNNQTTVIWELESIGKHHSWVVILANYCGLGALFVNGSYNNYSTKLLWFGSLKVILITSFLSGIWVSNYFNYANNVTNFMSKHRFQFTVIRVYSYIALWHNNISDWFEIKPTLVIAYLSSAWQGT